MIVRPVAGGAREHRETVIQKFFYYVDETSQDTRGELFILIRLADAVCGLVRGATEGQPAMRALLERGIQTGVLKDVSGK